VDVQDCLIAQETIDDLIQNFEEEDNPEPVVLDEDPAAEVESMSAPDPVAEAEEPVVDLGTDEKDEESFAADDSDAAVLDFGNEENGEVSQDDIDALLLESDDEAEDEDDILISQDDIDTLLMAADQEDEDVLGDLMDNTSDAGMDDDIEDEDILEDEDSDQVDDPYDEDQVVLEGDDEDAGAKPAPKKKKAGSGRLKSGWLKSRRVIACVSALVVLGITVPLSYFLFFSGEPNQKTGQDPITNLTVEPQREIEIEMVEIPAAPPAMDKNPGNMILKDFIILAPDLSKEMAYITADISIDYSDQRAYHEIQGNLSFYRDLIYDSLNKSLASQKREDITETDVLWIIETTLKKVLPGHYINRVSFKSFKFG
jgi:pilus assembly protein FimV